jgi:uncharacterized membrane protein
MQTTNQTPEREGQEQLIPFLWLRKGIGLLGFFFPVLLVVGSKLFGNCNKLLGSISDYYHTNMDDVFVAVLCVIGIFLFTYRGPEKEDSIASNLACLFALGIAFFPTSIKPESLSCLSYTAKTFPGLHNLFAASFFLVLSYFCLALFPKTHTDIPPTKEKLERNKLYKTCGYVMLASILIIFVYMLLKDRIDELKKIPITFIFEWVALWAFGISWIVKGGWFLQDKGSAKKT